MKSEEGERGRLPHPDLGANRRRWHQWLTYAVLFAAILGLVMTALGAASGIVEGFFVTLYSG